MFRHMPELRRATRLVFALEYVDPASLRAEEAVDPHPPSTLPPTPPNPN